MFNRRQVICNHVCSSHYHTKFIGICIVVFGISHSVFVLLSFNNMKLRAFAIMNRCCRELSDSYACYRIDCLAKHENELINRKTRVHPLAHTCTVCAAYTFSENKSNACKKWNSFWTNLLVIFRHLFTERTIFFKILVPWDSNYFSHRSERSHFSQKDITSSENIHVSSTSFMKIVLTKYTEKCPMEIEQ